MKLYLLEQTDESPGWDVFLGFVVCADTEESARKFASARSYGDEGKSIWLDPSQVRGELVGLALPDAVPGIVLESFQAG